MQGRSSRTSRTKSKDRSSSINVEFEIENIVLIETNVDDVTGEILSRAVERIFTEGAYDCTIIPNLGKKGRPGFTVRVVASKKMANKLAQLLVLETGTMGVKVYEAERWRVKRRIIKIPLHLQGYDGAVTVKVIETTGGSLRVKPEFEEMKQISELTGITVRQIEDGVRALAAKLLSES